MRKITVRFTRQLSRPVHVPCRCCSGWSRLQGPNKFKEAVCCVALQQGAAKPAASSEVGTSEADVCITALMPVNCVFEHPHGITDCSSQPLMDRMLTRTRWYKSWAVRYGGNDKDRWMQLALHF